MTRSWIAPAAAYLCMLLKPLQSRARFVIAGSYEVINRFPASVPIENQLATIDIENLYPSIDQNDLIARLGANLERLYMPDISLVRFARNLLEIVVKSQFLQHSTEFWCAQGIATGSSPGVFLANAYLSDLDESVTNDFDSNEFYFRYVDDALVCSSRIDEILVKLNDWHPNIKWVVTARGARRDFHESAVPFLDLSLTIENAGNSGSIIYETHRKDLNGYLYVPRSSAHPKNVFASIVKSEVFRLFKTNSREKSLQKHLLFFANKMQVRGYRRSVVLKIAEQFLQYLRKQRDTASRPQKAFFLQTFSGSLNQKSIRNSIRKHQHLLEKSGLPKIALSFKVQPNLFRNMYQQNWNFENKITNNGRVG